MTSSTEENRDRDGRGTLRPSGPGGGGIPQAVSDLWDWLSRWKDGAGGVHGYVVHHHRDNMRVMTPDTWTQSACIMGCLNLYRKTSDEEWLATATGLGEYLVKTYIHQLHVYANSNHEHKPLGKPEVVSNALPSYALLELAGQRQELGLDGSAFSRVAEDNIRGFLLAGWSQKEGAVASADQGPDHFVLNMNGFCAMAFASWSRLTGDTQILRKNVNPIRDFIRRNQIRSGPRKGGFPYRKGSGNCISLYTLMTAYSLLATSAGEDGGPYVESALEAVKHVMTLYDAQEGLVSHQDRTSPPLWVPDTSLLIATSKRLTESGHGDVAMAVDGLLTHQQASGGFPLSVGFSDLFDEKLLPCRPEVKRWRDCLPTPNWNSWVFWHLSEALETGVRLPPPRTEYPFVLTTDKEEREGPYTITDDGSAVTFKSQDGVLKGLFVKQHDAPLVCNIQERDEGFRLRMRLQRYPSLARRAIFAGADLFG